jgi:uncharacterized phage protein (TIGR02218 family)
LFSVLCGVDRTAYDVPAVVASIVNSFTFTVSGISNPDGWFNQGVAITPSGLGIELATWQQSSQTVTTYLPLVGRILSAGDNITMYPGCDKTIDTANGCRRFSNQINFQGEPHFTGTAAAAQQVP